MTEKEMFENLISFYNKEVKFYLAAGFTMKQIARILYEKGEISFIERNILAKGVEEYAYEIGLD